MIEAARFIEEARARGLDFYTGVPCSFLTPLINRTISDLTLDYVGAASEGEAVAIAAGAWLAGRGSVVMCQNSGLGNTVNPLTSLNWPFRIPALLIVTWRGQPGLKDEPQHELMGRVTGSLLETIDVAHDTFPAEDADIAPALDSAVSAMDERQLPFALVMAKGSVGDESLEQAVSVPPEAGAYRDETQGGRRTARISVLERVLDVVPPEAAIVATTGKCGRELFTLADREQHLYQVGSMGCASAMGLGVALNVERPVVVLDGDGAALMKLGAFATIGAYRPANLVHIVLDNGVHDSTGGQATVSAGVDFARIAAACGYRSGWLGDDLGAFHVALEEALRQPGPALLHFRIRPGSLKDLGRPTVKPAEVARRFQAFLRS